MVTKEKAKEKLSSIPSWTYALVVAIIVLIGQWYVNGYRIDQLEKDINNIVGLKEIHVLELKIKDIESDIKILKFRHTLSNTTGLGITR